MRVGPLVTIAHFTDGPTRNIRPLPLNGPMSAFPSSSVEMHMGFIDYYDKHLLHYVRRSSLEYRRA
jgi:hypothetical protein